MVQFKDDFAEPCDGLARAVWVRIADLILDKRYQSRSRLNDRVAERYAALIRRGEQFPPVDVAIIEGRPCVYDGFHRVEAHIRAGRTEIRAICRDATEAQAETWAGCANHTHGLPLSAADAVRAREKAVSGYIKSRQHLKGKNSARSLAEIARDLSGQGCPISRGTVRNILRKRHPATYARFYQAEEGRGRGDHRSGDDGALAEAMAALAGFTARAAGLDGVDRREAIQAAREALKDLKTPQQRTRSELEKRAEGPDTQSEVSISHFCSYSSRLTCLSVYG